ncbi:hypothetical protein [Herpetosiphon giganteus]|uniref:hypothetical protein n=1 Tax=Herpetosiphon giganteus TaxID=2029754 RepID=UPI0019574B64|nr:hypothetical protein [Herpetosiphon giganteus]MBM7844429.1 hypothetical protein [Herpetosiphon giganteus]
MTRIFPALDTSIEQLIPYFVQRPRHNNQRAEFGFSFTPKRYLTADRGQWEASASFAGQQWACYGDSIEEVAYQLACLIHEHSA